jgi:hypothetical protein
MLSGTQLTESAAIQVCESHTEKQIDCAFAEFSSRSMGVETAFKKYYK